MTTSKLRFDAVYKAYDRNLVLRGVSLDVQEHEVVCLIGGSGSGKSTLLRCANLLEEINAGQIYLNGESIIAPGVHADRIRQRIGLVFQSYNLFPHMSVLKNITFAQQIVLRRSRSEAERRAFELLERFGLSDKARAFPDHLSGGQQQRVAVVRAMALDPEVLLLDEITSALDPVMVGEVLNVIRELKTLGMTMILATHHMGFARHIADRIAFLEGGEIIEIGPPAQLFDAPHDPRTKEFLDRVLASE
ncbi:MAG: amino acid ABC transporter ATP-binding protein [Thermomicrobiales bacterium]|nr:amino acid ABC transporter ATP-binding protein [Thermomicrobiales bacterium]